jgi:AMMECR1 domain-containing protein
VRKLTLFFAVLTLCTTQSVWAASQKNNSEQPTQLAALPIPPAERVNLPQLAREALAVHFNASRFDTLDQLIQATPVCDDYKKPAGLFVTLSSHGKTRACWGSVTPTNQDLVRATVSTTESALTKEYRFPAVRASEWRSLKCQVTIVHSIEPLADISQQNALKYGLLVQYGGRGAVLLPGEVMDAHCQLLKCKLKAGIPVDQPCQIYRIRADVHK